jgi:oligopeptide transport system permease protein
LPPEIIKNLEAKYGMDRPLIEQYFAYMQNLLSKGDLGPSLKYPNRSVSEILLQALPVSLSLGLIAFSLALFFGLTAGSLAALFPGKLAGKIPSLAASFGMSMPSFIFGALLIGVFGLWLNTLPVALWEGPEYAILPSITLAVAPAAYITRITRTAMLDTISKEHIKTALAKGLSYSQVVLRHGLRNSIIPVLSIAGPLAAVLITGSFVVEHIFALPGMGKYFVSAFINRDYFLVSGTVVIFSLILLLINAVTDLVLPLLDPRLD